MKYLFIAFGFFPVFLIAQNVGNVQIYLAKSYDKNSFYIDESTIELDSVLVSNEDLIKYNNSTFEFTLTENAAPRSCANPFAFGQISFRVNVD